MNQTISGNAEGLLQSKKEVPATFDKIARRYDFATFLSQGYAKDLQCSVKLMDLQGDEYLLDLCCGTGKSTVHCLQAVPDGKVLAIDNSKEMLRIAASNLAVDISEDKCQILQEDVMNLDMADHSVDAIFMAYGIRNMPNYEACIKNLYRMLKPGGIIGFHEYSLPKKFFNHLYWRILGYGIIIPFSALITGNLTIFKYLIKSVLAFPSPSQFREMIAGAGFKDVSVYPQKSWRKFILHTFIAKKPF
jgi:ubiquinone/menaquinone biosynthesis methyltransferase